MRNTIVIAALAAGLTMFTAGIGKEAGAVNRVPSAPVGHRQPAARDVPSTSRSSAEEARKKMDEELERQLKSICRGC